MYIYFIRQHLNIIFEKKKIMYKSSIAFFKMNPRMLHLFSFTFISLFVTGFFQIKIELKKVSKLLFHNNKRHT